jgi:hypothetical protein
MFILSGDEHQLMPNENREILRLQNENGRWNRESYVYKHHLILFRLSFTVQ